jgi:hypothetical protein
VKIHVNTEEKKRAENQVEELNFEGPPQVRDPLRPILNPRPRIIVDFELLEEGEFKVIDHPEDQIVYG